MEASDNRCSIAAFTEIGVDTPWVKALMHSLGTLVEQIRSLMTAAHPFIHLVCNRASITHTSIHLGAHAHMYVCTGTHSTIAGNEYIQRCTL